MRSIILLVLLITIPLFAADTDYADIARKHYEAGRYQEAIKYYEKAIEENPQDSSSCQALGDIYWQMNNYEIAIKWFGRIGKYEHKYNL